MFNKLFAFFLLFLFAPFLLLISIFIYLEDGFPIIFKQKRVGVDSTLFNIYKFRTMRNDTPEVATDLLTNKENYILNTGRFLRKSSLDELPNFLNIIKGEMNFVGPRPALYNQFDLIELRKELGIDKLTPGITGYAQINGRDDISLKTKVGLDKFYLSNKSLFLDLKIIFITLIRIFQSKNITH